MIFGPFHPPHECTGTLGLPKTIHPQHPSQEDEEENKSLHEYSLELKAIQLQKRLRILTWIASEKAISF
jgi:hypothetical protein